VAQAGTRIRIVQHGGFAGTVEQVDLHGGRLPAAAAAEFDAARAQLEALAGSAATASSGIGADLAHYSVEIVDGGSVRRFDLPDTAGRGQSFGQPEIGSIIQRLRRLSDAG
jgi:hypothetical protein